VTAIQMFLLSYAPASSPEAKKCRKKLAVRKVEGSGLRRRGEQAPHFTRQVPGDFGGFIFVSGFGKSD
jgi:hypothetical protein